MDDPKHRIRGALQELLASTKPSAHQAAIRQYLHPSASLTLPFLAIDSSVESRDVFIVPALESFRDSFPVVAVATGMIAYDHTRENVFVRAEMALRPWVISEEVARGSRIRVPLFVSLHLMRTSKGLWIIDRLEFVVPTVELLRSNHLGRLVDYATYLSWALIRLTTWTLQWYHVEHGFQRNSGLYKASGTLARKFYHPSLCFFIWRLTWCFWLWPILSLVNFYINGLLSLWILFRNGFEFFTFRRREHEVELFQTLPSIPEKEPKIIVKEVRANSPQPVVREAKNGPGEVGLRQFVKGNSNLVSHGVKNKAPGAEVKKMELEETGLLPANAETGELGSVIANTKGKIEVRDAKETDGQIVRTIVKKLDGE